ncbi:hypothetical protein ACI5KX_12985 [Erythrobacter sp. GH1-10]|uniref:hypothetical protein n=1 Tax=Erythrobacter sp. GH1-10 TaxID=3349334 RepID=UPI003878061A
MKIALIALPIALLATPAMAETVELECYLDTEQGRQDWSVNLNEGSRTVTFAHQYGKQTNPAVFKANEIRWAFGDLRIDRTTLQFTRRNSYGKRDLGTDTGQCRVAQADGRLEVTSDTRRVAREG